MNGALLSRLATRAPWFPSGSPGRLNCRSSVLVSPSGPTPVSGLWKAVPVALSSMVRPGWQATPASVHDVLPGTVTCLETTVGGSLVDVSAPVVSLVVTGGVALPLSSARFWVNHQPR